MTQEEKQLLLKDLCTRLPYGVVLDTGTKVWSIDVLTEIVSGNGTDKKIEERKYYLRPMSSMTEEEKEERASIVTVVYNGEVIDDDFINIIQYVDWLNANHFDYHDLISKGLALEAPEGMYK